MPAAGYTPAGRAPKISGSQSRQRVSPQPLIAGLAGPLHLGEPDDPGAIDHESTAIGVAGVAVENSVGLADLAVRPEIRQHREREPAFERPDLVRGRRADRDRQRRAVVVLEFGQVVTHPVQLALADPGECQREEDQQDVLGTAIGAQADGLLILVTQREVRGGGADGQHQRFPARDFGCTNRLALQSPRLTDEVGIRPAVGAASAISAGRT